MDEVQKVRPKTEFGAFGFGWNFKLGFRMRKLSPNFSYERSLRSTGQGPLSTISCALHVKFWLRCFSLKKTIFSKILTLLNNLTVVIYITSPYSKIETLNEKNRSINNKLKIDQKLERKYNKDGLYLMVYYSFIYNKQVFSS